MEQRNDKLNRLKVGFACQTSWEAMTGDERRRFCDECRREVLDFAQMTSREIRAHLEASQGKTCGRLTFDGSRLRVLQPIESSESNAPRLARRPSPLAATLVTAWLGLSAAAAAQPTTTFEPVPATPLSPEKAADAAKTRRAVPTTQGVTLRGRVVVEGQGLAGVLVVARQALDGRELQALSREDGSFVFRNLEAGVYDLSGTLEDFEVEALHNVVLEAGLERKVELQATFLTEISTVGDVVTLPSNLLELFEESTLVVSGVTGTSVVLTSNGSRAEIATTLEIAQVVKGDFAGTALAYRHSKYLTQANSPAGPPPGVKVLAFLTQTEEATEEFYSLADFGRGLLQLPADEHHLYFERLEALAEVKGDPGELVEWLVATTENPTSRVETAIELRVALEDLHELATREGQNPELLAASLRRALATRRKDENAATRPIFLAAMLNESHKQRLIDALLATESLGDGDRILFLVVERLDRATARKWLRDRLRTAETRLENTLNLYWWLQHYADNLEIAAAATLAAEASALANGLEYPMGDLEDPSEREKLECFAAINRNVMVKLADLLESHPSPPE